jgi:hypothetical protein
MFSCDKQPVRSAGRSPDHWENYRLGGREEEWKTGRVEDVMYPAIVLVLVVVLEFPGIRISEDEDEDENEDENRRIRLPVQPFSPTFYCLCCFRGGAGCRTQIGA